MSILVSGTLAYDHIMNFPDSFRNHLLPEQLHILNVCFVVDQLETNFGGTAGNIAYTIKLLSSEPMVVGALGKDGEKYLAYLKKNKIKTTYIAIDKKIASAAAHITTDQDDNQITAFFNGPSALAPSARLALQKYACTVALISPTEKNTMIKHLLESRQQGATVVFDPGQQTTAFSAIELKKLIGQADMVIGNDYEIKLIQEKTGWDDKTLLAEAKVLITTLGEQGSTVTTREGTITVASAAPRSVDDPTGAGDAYRAGFFVGYEKGNDLKTCAQIGSVAASFAIENYGTQNHTFTIPEFQERYQKTYNEKMKLN